MLNMLVCRCCIIYGQNVQFNMIFTQSLVLINFNKLSILKQSDILNKLYVYIYFHFATGFCRIWHERFKNTGLSWCKEQPTKRVQRVTRQSVSKNKIQKATNVKGGTSLLIDIQAIRSSYIFTVFSKMFISNDSVTLQES